MSFKTIQFSQNTGCILIPIIGSQCTSEADNEQTQYKPHSDILINRNSILLPFWDVLVVKLEFKVTI